MIFHVRLFDIQYVNRFSGITYSQANFTLAGFLNDEDAKRIEQYAQGIKAITRKLAVAADEYINVEGAETEDIM